MMALWPIAAEGVLDPSCSTTPPRYLVRVDLQNVTPSVPETDPESRFGRGTGVKPREATAAGGLGLTLVPRP